jgi:hypothetical protein
MKPSRTIGALTAVAALALPASAFAHGSVFETEARLGAGPETQTQYVVTNHGFTFVLKETNSAADQGMVNYKKLPRAYRDTLPDKADWFAAGDTGAQPHATCRGVAALDEAAVLAWQGADPFYNYVPWQKASAGLEDDPAKWIAVVQAETGVDLATAADPAAACTGVGGTYTPADEIQTTAKALSSGTIEEETAPLTAEIGKLTTALTTADGLRAALQTALDAAKAELTKLGTPMQAALPTAKLKGKALARKGTTVAVTGTAGAPVTVELAVSEGQARKLKLKSSVLATTKATIGADGTATVGVRAKKAARKALRKLKRAVAFEVTVTSGDRFTTAGGSLTR